jgi:hypothetical protein
VGADAGSAFADDAVKLAPPIVGGRGIVDFAEGAPCDLAAVNAIEAGAGQPNTIVFA